MRSSGVRSTRFISLSANKPTAAAWRFSVPVVAREAVVLGLMRLEPFGFRIVELDSEGLGSVGARKGGFIEVELDSDLRSGAHSWAEVTTFAKRL